jgi:16S rRNA (cytosine1402-N4)-methyltransferase
VTEGFIHHPVLVELIVELFRPVPPGVVVDTTVGGGGHARAILEARHDLTLVAIDRDLDALAAAADRLAPFGERITLRHARFDALETIMTDLHDPPVSGVLFDLGVSSPQLDRADRGFSYRQSGPLDMRMDRTEERNAADVVNAYDEVRLIATLKAGGEDRHAERIARAIIAARPIETTSELAAVVASAIPAPARRRGGHPAKRTFQAIRIEVNRELALLAPALNQAIDLTQEGGRVVVMSYHSGEDRITKDVFRTAATGGCTCPPGLPCVCDAVQTVRLVKAGAWKATPAEIAANPRAESVRVRAVEKIAPRPRRA